MCDALKKYWPEKFNLVKNGSNQLEWTAVKVEGTNLGINSWGLDENGYLKVNAKGLTNQSSNYGVNDTYFYFNKKIFKKSEYSKIKFSCSTNSSANESTGAGIQIFYKDASSALNSARIGHFSYDGINGGDTTTNLPSSIYENYYVGIRLFVYNQANVTVTIRDFSLIK